MTQGENRIDVHAYTGTPELQSDGSIAVGVTIKGSATIDGEHVVIEENKTIIVTPKKPSPRGPHRSIFADPRQTHKI